MIATWASSRGAPASFPGLAFWFRFGIGITSAGGFVSQWSDQSGNGRHLLQATGAAQPALQGDNTILFDGVAHFMKCAPFTLSQPETIYLRFRQVTWTNADRIADGDAVNSAAIQQGSVTPQIAVFAGVSGTPNGNLAVNTYGALAAVINGASSVTQVDNTAAITSNSGAANMGGFTLAASAAGTAFGNIQVKEVVGYSAAHDQATRDAIIAYLNRL